MVYIIKYKSLTTLTILVNKVHWKTSDFSYLLANIVNVVNNFFMIACINLYVHGRNSM